MNLPFRSLWVCCVSVLLTCGSTQAQFRLDIETVALDAYEEETDTNEYANVELANNARFRPVIVRNLNRMIFNQHQSPAVAKKHFHNELRKWIDVADAKLELTADERAKLWLAGSSDIANFFNNADEVNLLLAKGNNAQGMNAFRLQLAELQVKMQKGVCSEGSMLAKVAKRTFDAERSGAAAAHAAARRRFAHEASVKLVIAEVEKTMPLTIKQRKQLVDALLKHEPEKLVGHRTYYNHALARLRDKAIQAMFEPAQIQRLRIALANAKNRGEAAVPSNFIDFELKL